MSKVAKIALVHDFLFTFGGAERVLQTFHELFPEAPIYTLFAYPEVVSKHFPTATIITSSLQRHPLRRWPPLLLGSMPRAIEEFDFNGFDVVLSSSGAFSHGIITGPETTHICYCHTPMRYAWDWHHEYLNERGLNRPITGLYARSLLSRLRIWDKVSAARVDRFLCNSGAVAERIAKFYRQPATIIYPPIDRSALEKISLEQSPATPPYAISASRLTPNKRIDVIIKGCAEAGMPLKILGSGSQQPYLETVAKESGATIEFLGHVSENDKVKLIASASCFIFAAEDDFGIAPAEALTLGVPLISLARGGIQEVIKEGKNGLLFPEPTSTSLAQALARFNAEGVAMSRRDISHSVEHLSLEHFKKAILAAVQDA